MISLAPFPLSFGPVRGETYFYQGRPVTVIEIDDGTCRIRASNISPKLDIWIKWEELS